MPLINNNERSFLFWAALSLVAILLSESMTRVKGYPMMVEVAEADERCLRLNIPEDDDAHMIFLVLPSADHESEQDGGDSPLKWSENYDKLENHFMDQMQEITKRRAENSSLQRKFPVKPPPDVQKSMDDFLSGVNGMKTPLELTLTNPKSTNSRSMDTYFFTPLVINHVRRAIRTQKKDRESSPLEGYLACFENHHTENPIHVVVDSVLVSEGPDYDDDEDDEPIFQGHHLTPLAEQVDESIRAAKSVVNEMRYMERREARMRHTADSINARVRYFSYISVAILLVVTYLQVTYLKRYFRKKKLL